MANGKRDPKEKRQEEQNPGARQRGHQSEIKSKFNLNAHYLHEMQICTQADRQSRVQTQTASVQASERDLQRPE